MASVPFDKLTPPKFTDNLVLYLSYSPVYPLSSIASPFGCLCAPSTCSKLIIIIIIIIILPKLKSPTLFPSLVNGIC